jgi:hypothetical protein
MPAGNTVRPAKWSNVIPIYDDGEYSAIWGNYDNSPNRVLGVRWNGSGTDVGYPNQGAYPTWFVEPDCLTKMILLEFCFTVNQNPSYGDLQNILTALNECP